MSDTKNEPVNADELADLTAEAEALEPNTSAETGEQLPAEVDQPGMTNEQAIQMMLGPLFAILAPNWQVSGQEIEQLAQAYAPVVEKYMPGDLAMGVEMQAIMVTAIIVAPRAHVPRNDAAAKRAAEKAEAKKQRQDADADREKAKRDATAQPADDDRPAIDMSGLTDDGDNTPGAEHEPAA